MDKQEGTLHGVLIAEGTLYGILQPADTGAFVADFATDQDIIDLFKDIKKGEDENGSN